MPAGQRKTASPADSRPAHAAISRREWLVIAVVVAAAVALRAIYVLQYKAHIPYYSALIADSAYYDEWARRVAAGQGYGPMPFYMAPLYPYVLSLVYSVTGHKLVVVYILQAGLGAANLLLVYLLGRRLFGHWAGLAGMLLLLLYSPVTYLETKLLSETLGITLGLLSVLLLVRAFGRATRHGYLVAGLVLGLTALCRPAMLVYIAAAIIWIFLNRPRSQRGLCGGVLIPFALGLCLAVLPVTARNYLVGRDLVLISTNSGMTFWHGNNPDARGVCAVPPGLTTSILDQQNEEMALAARSLGRDVTPSESSGYWLGRGLSFIRRHPGAYARLLGNKVVWSLHGREAPCNYNLYLERRLVPVLRLLFVPFPLILGLAVLGFVLARREGIRESGLLVLYGAAIFVGLVVFFVSSRYRAPAVPILAVPAGFGFVRIVGSLRARNYGTLTLAAACIAACVLLSLIPYPVPPVTAEGPANLGYSFMQMGRYDEAVAQFREAIRLKPDYLYAQSSLGEALVQGGRYFEAMEHYAEIAADNPDDAEAQSNLGAVLERMGMLDAAVMRYTIAVRLKPDFTVARYNLALVLGRQGKLKEAISQLLLLRQAKPDDPSVHYCLGVMYKRANRPDDAIAAYREAIRLSPGLAEAHNNLAVVLFEKGDYGGAWRAVKLARRYGAEPNPAFIRALSAKMPEP